MVGTKVRKSGKSRQGADGRLGADRNRSAQTLAAQFPELAADPSVDRTIAQDLLLSEAQFGAKYRKGKKKRLAELDALNSRLLLEKLQAERNATQGVIRELRALLEDGEGSVHSMVSIPRTEQQARMAFRLWFLRERSKNVEFALELDELSLKLRNLGFDDVNVKIARRVVLPVGRTLRATEISTSENMSRQSVYLRISRVIKELSHLVDDADLVQLINEVSSNCRLIEGRLRIPLHHPLLGISGMGSSGDFGQVGDVMRVAIHCTACRRLLSAGDSVRLFKWEVIEIEGNQYLELR